MDGLQLCRLPTYVQIVQWQIASRSRRRIDISAAAINQDGKMTDIHTQTRKPQLIFLCLSCLLYVMAFKPAKGMSRTGTGGPSETWGVAKRLQAITGRQWPTHEKNRKKSFAVGASLGPVAPEHDSQPTLNNNAQKGQTR